MKFPNLHLGQEQDILSIITFIRKAANQKGHWENQFSARDLSLLKANYRIELSQAIDLFPQTQHVENVVLLIRL